MKMKKIFSMILCGMILTACCACGNNGSDTDSSSETSAYQDSNQQSDADNSLDTDSSNETSEYQDSNQQSDADNSSDTESSNETSASQDSNKPSDENVEITLEEVMAHDVSPEEDFETLPYYDENRNETDFVKISGYKGNDSIVVIPETIGGKKVIELSSCFYDNKSLGVKAVKLADNIESIELMACTFNDNIEMVVCGKGLKTIEAEAFYGCDDLKELVLNDGLENIEHGAITSCDRLNELTIPDTVKNIEDGAVDIKTIKGKTGSTAEEYAKKAGLKFEAIE